MNYIIGVDDIKTFSLFLMKRPCQLVLNPGLGFQPSLIFTSKAGSCLDGATSRHSV